MCGSDGGVLGSGSQKAQVTLPVWFNERLVFLLRVGMYAGSVCFVATLLPIFLRLTIADVPVAAFVSEDGQLGVLVGCALGSFILMVVPQRRFEHAVALLGFASVCVGHSVSWFVSDSVFQVLSGILFGTGLAFLSISWFLLLRDTPFVRILTHTALVVLGALLVNGMAFLLQAEAATALRELLLFVGVVVVLACVLVEPPEGGVTRVAARESDGRDETPREELRGLASSLLALVAFAVYSNSLDNTFDIPHVSQSFLGLLLAAVLVLAMARLVPKKALVPFSYWMAFPCAAALLVFFGKLLRQTVLFRVGSLGAAVLFSALGIFAIAFLASVCFRDGFPVLRTMGLSLALLSGASIVGRMLGLADLAQDDRGSIVFVVSTAFMVYVMLSPAFQLWKTRKDAESEETAPVERQSENKALVHEGFAREWGLTPREEEVLMYVNEGYNAPYIAKALFVSDSTVRTHLKSIYRKTQTSSRMELIDLMRGERGEGGGKRK